MLLSIPWLRDTLVLVLSASSLGVLPVCLCFLIKTRVIQLGPFLIKYDCLSSNYICKHPYFQMKSHVRFWVDVTNRRTLFEPVVVIQSPLFVTPWTEACQASLSLTIFCSLPKFMSSESVMPFNHLIFCHPLLLLTSISPSIITNTTFLRSSVWLYFNQHTCYYLFEVIFQAILPYVT